MADTVSTTEAALRDLAAEVAKHMDPAFTVSWEGRSRSSAHWAVGDIVAKRGSWTGVQAVRLEWLTPTGVTKVAPMLASQLQRMWGNLEGVVATDIFDGYVDIDDGVVDVRLGGPAGIGDPDRERRILAGLLLGRLAEDEGAVRAVADHLAMEDYGQRAWPAYEGGARDLLAALDRYLSGEQGDV